MRAHRTTLVALGMLGFALACTGDKDVPPPDSEVEVLVDSPQSDDSEPSTEDTSYGEDFDTTAPSFTATLDGADWSTDDGFWTRTSISATIPDAAQAEVVTIIVDGDLRFAGSYPVSSMSYSQTPSQGSPIIYSSENDPDVRVTVLGFSDDNTYIFANVEGGTDLGGIAFAGAEVRGWPPF